MKNAGIFLHSSKTVSVSFYEDWFFGFYAQKNIFNYVKVGALHWPWKGTKLMDARQILENIDL